MRIIVYPHLMTIGGSQINAIELAAAVRDRGHEVFVFGAESGPLIETVGKLGLPLVIGPPHGRRPSIGIARMLRELCRREHIDIVHCYEWPPCLEGFYGTLFFDAVTVGCTVLSMSVAPFIPRSIPLIVGTEQIASATRINRTGRVDVIEPPVDTKSNHPAIDGDVFRRQYGLESYVAIVLVSRLAVTLKLEGIERAIRAVALLAKTNRLRLVIVGDGPARQQLSRLGAEVNAHAKEPIVTFTGELADPRPAYAAGDVVLGMGGSALRAMAFSKPVIVLGELGFAELLTPESASVFLWQGFYGLGNGDQRPENLADLLRPLVTSRARRSDLGTFSRKLVESRFSLAAAAKRQESFYQKWLEERATRSTLIAEATRTSARFLSYKIRQRLDRWWTRRSAFEDFNTTSEIAKTAELGGKRG
jgi:glycosyltransferase involved in cell wall biosynthesis